MIQYCINVPSLLPFSTAHSKNIKLNGSNTAEIETRIISCFDNIAIVYPPKIESRKASNEYVIGTKKEKNFIPAGSNAIGKTAPPNNEPRAPNIRPKGSPCLKIIVPTAEKIPNL